MMLALLLLFCIVCSWWTPPFSPQSSQSLWNRLSVLLNLLPASAELQDSGEWGPKTIFPLTGPIKPGGARSYNSFCDKEHFPLT